jgi:hypothetical protein
MGLKFNPLTGNLETKPLVSHLYHQGTEKVFATSAGFRTTGEGEFDGGIRLTDTRRIKFGDNADFEIYHNGTNNYLDSSNGHIYLRLKDTGGNQENAIKCTQNGNVEISFDGTKKLETLGGGVDVTGYLDTSDGGTFTASGAYGISIHNTNNPSMGHLFIYGDNGLIRFRNNSNTYTARIGYNEGSNSLFLHNQEAGTDLGIIADGAKLGDNKKFIAGNDSDLSIYHTGTDSRMINAGSDLLMYTTGSHQVKIQSNSLDSVVCVPNESTKLYFDGQEKLKTRGDGAQVYGTLTASGLTSAGGLTTEGGYINLQGSETRKILLQGVDGNFIQYRNASGVFAANLTSVGNGDTFRIQNEKSGGNIFLDSTRLEINASQIDFNNLPTSDPAVSGRLWNDSGTVKISAG